MKENKTAIITTRYEIWEVELLIETITKSNLFKMDYDKDTENGIKQEKLRKLLTDLERIRLNAEDWLNHKIQEELAVPDEQKRLTSANPTSLEHDD